MKMSTVNKAVLAALLTAALIGGARDAVLRNRINDLEGQRDIYASRLANWQDRAIRDEEIIDQLQAEEQTALPGELIAGICRGVPMHRVLHGKIPAYLRHRRQHHRQRPADSGRCDSGGRSDTSSLRDRFCTLEGIGIRVVQDKGAGVQGYHLDVAVDTHENALAWSGYGEHRVWIIKEEER